MDMLISPMIYDRVNLSSIMQPLARADIEPIIPIRHIIDNPIIDKVMLWIVFITFFDGVLVESPGIISSRILLMGSIRWSSSATKR